jgi:hypothetical protein
MRILFRKHTDERHTLEIVQDGGRREGVECETRSYLLHDLLHYAVESEAGLGGGFWGNLERGKTLADMNDRTGQAMISAAPEMAVIERIVGALSAAAKGMPAARMVALMGEYAQSLDTTLPAWLTERLVVAVQERIRRLIGEWKATPYGGTMELAWPARSDASIHDVPGTAHGMGSLRMFPIVSKK